MPRSPTQPPPSSSLARLLDPQSAARALQPADPSATDLSRNVGAQASAPAGIPGRSRLIKREITLCPATDETLTRLVDLYRRATGTRLNTSLLIRAVLRALALSLPELEHHARQIGTLRLPPNASGTAVLREQFERRLAEAVIAGVDSTAEAQGLSMSSLLAPGRRDAVRR